MIASLLLLATFVLLGLPIALVCIPWCLVTRDVMPLYRSAMFVVRLGLRVAGIRVRVTGLESVPRGRACIFMCNHVSNLDPPVLIPLIPGRTSVFLKRSLMKIPILGYGMRLAEFVPVDRGGKVDEARESAERAKAVLAKGIHITTFVEGTRSLDGKLLPFKKGPFYLAMESGAPCVPISISGTETMMRKGSLRIHPGTVRVVFHVPVYPAEVGGRDELMEAVRQAIASGLPELMRPDSEESSQSASDAAQFLSDEAQ
jgi:1-acyl-sn-glycerol-3-phosphate acyltransferase